MECIFCKIVNNESPSYTIYEDEIVKVKVGDTILDNVHIKIADSYATSFHINKDDAINHHIEASMTGVIIKED